MTEQHPNTLTKQQSPSASSVIEFLNICSNLKTIKRTGWVRRGISLPESISDHMWFVSLLTLLVQDSCIDKTKCLKMAVVHDLAEAIVGDITPHDGISKEEKHRREKEAIEKMCCKTLNSSIGQEIVDLWSEYETAETPEAKLVKQLDKFEMMFQAVQYEKLQGHNLQEFFESGKKQITHPQLLQWINELENQRTQINQTTKITQQ